MIYNLESWSRWFVGFGECLLISGAGQGALCPRVKESIDAKARKGKVAKARDDAWIGGKANIHQSHRIVSAWDGATYSIISRRARALACGCWDWEQRESLLVGISARMGMVVSYRIASIWVSVPATATSCWLLFLCPFFDLDLDHFHTPPSISSNQLAYLARI